MVYIGFDTATGTDYSMYWVWEYGEFIALTRKEWAINQIKMQPFF